MEGILEDLIGEILLRLPVKALLRFRCVSKSWRNLIDSPNFVKSQSILPNKQKIVMMAVVLNKKPSIYYSELDSDFIGNPSLNFKEVTLPWRDESFCNISHFVGQCNGLLCWVYTSKCTFLIFNPFIGKYIQIPPPPEQQIRLWTAWGFGYDKDSDDYKVVALACKDLLDVVGMVLWIYSLKSNSWKTIANFQHMLMSGFGVFFNGALHWSLNYRGGTSEIFALNLRNSEYLTMPLPSDIRGIFSPPLGVVDGCLYAISSDYFKDDYDLWVMKEYGLTESWTRLSTYNGHYNDAEFLFVRYGSSPVQCNFASFWRKIWNESLCGESLLYEPSLVCAPSGI